MADQNPQSGLAWKLVLAFLLSMGLIGFAAWYAYDNFNKLLGSVQTLSTPDNSSDVLRSLVDDMHAADNDMRNYIMSNDNASLQSYISTMEQISVELDNMQQDQAFSGQVATLDTLEEYFQDKADLMYSLVIFKQSNEYDRLNSKAMQTLSGQAESNDVNKSPTQVSPKLSPGIKSTTITQQNQSTATDKKKSKESKKDEGFLRNLFGSKKKDSEDPTQPATTQNTPKRDSIAIESNGYTIDLAEAPHVNMEDVRSILKQIDDDQKRYNTKLTEKELEILTSDKLIIQQIDAILARLQIQQSTRIAGQVMQAQQNAHRSSRIMLIVAGVALLIGLIFFVVIVMDMIRSNRYKLQLIDARNRAEYLAKAKEEFLANMSHEIRTPLNAIIGFSEQIEHTILQPEQQRYIKAVSHAGTHLLNTVNDILDLSKIEAGKLPVDHQPLIIQEILNEVVSILSVKAQEKNFPLSVAVGEHADIPVMGDAFRIKQMLYNIVGNAIKFTDHGFVELSCSAEKTKKDIQYSISVRDTGIGIPEDKLDHIFDIFEQAETTTARKYGGTGLGLSISRKLARLMGGDIRVKSVVGEGTEFIVHLPMRIASASELAQTPAEQKVFADLHGLEILLVDDEPYNLLLAEVILKKFGANSTTAANGKEAIQLIESRSFDIVLADLHMPEVDGYMLANRIREIYLQVPLIALTANVMQSDIERIRKAGFNDILLKPYKESALLSMIGKYAPVVIGTAAQDVEEETNTLIGIQPLYTLEEVLRFADQDEQVLAAIIESFIQSNSANVTILEQAAQEGNLELVRNTAHKMLPSYNHFGVHTLVPVLRELESAQASANGAILEQAQQVATQSTQVFAELQKEIEIRV